jgi:hypothetical protein
MSSPYKYLVIFWNSAADRATRREFDHLSKHVLPGCSIDEKGRWIGVLAGESEQVSILVNRHCALRIGILF